MKWGSNQMEVVSHFCVRKCWHTTESRMRLGGRVFKMFMPDCRERGEVLLGSVVFLFKVLSFNLLQLELLNILYYLNYTWIYLNYLNILYSCHVVFFFSLNWMYLALWYNYWIFTNSPVNPSRRLEWGEEQVSTDETLS